MSAGRCLAAIQTVPQRGDVRANLDEHVRLSRIAAREGARLLLFPELSLTGYELDLVRELAFHCDDPRLAPLRDETSALGVTIVAGAPVHLEGRLFLGALVLGADGRVDVYTKHRLGAFAPQDNPGGAVPPAESTVFEPGLSNPLVPSNGHLAAVSICADIRRQEHPQEAAARGATVYLSSMFVIPADLARELGVLRGFATTHGFAVVFANFGGATGGMPSAGSSAVISPDGHILAQLPADGTGVVVAIEDDGGWRAKAVPA